MIKAAFFDVDGTFYSHKIHGVPESNLKALEALKSKGIKTFLATGRHFEELEDLGMDGITFDGYVMLTGQICTDQDKNLIFGNPIKREHAELYGGKEVEKELAKKVPNCTFTRWSDFGVDIISKDGGKVIGIQKVLEHYGIKREELIAFGDGENDLDMIQFAGIGVAMGNAVAETKAVADYVTTAIDDNGIWNACKHFGLI